MAFLQLTYIYISIMVNNSCHLSHTSWKWNLILACHLLVSCWHYTVILTSPNLLFWSNQMDFKKFGQQKHTLNMIFANRIQATFEGCLLVSPKLEFKVLCHSQCDTWGCKKTQMHLSIAVFSLVILYWLSKTLYQIWMNSSHVKICDSGSFKLEEI